MQMCHCELHTQNVAVHKVGRKGSQKKTCLLSIHSRWHRFLASVAAIVSSAHLGAILWWCIAVVNHGLDETLAQLGAVVVDVGAHCTGVCSNCLHATRTQPALQGTTCNRFAGSACLFKASEASPRDFAHVQRGRFQQPVEWPTPATM